jgi:hypothetical protein
MKKMESLKLIKLKLEQRQNNSVDLGLVTKHKRKQIQWQNQRFIYARHVRKMWRCFVLASTVSNVLKRIVEEVDHL